MIVWALLGALRLQLFSAWRQTVTYGSFEMNMAAYRRAYVAVIASALLLVAVVVVAPAPAVGLNGRLRELGVLLTGFVLALGVNQALRCIAMRRYRRRVDSRQGV